MKFKFFSLKKLLVIWVPEPELYELYKDDESIKTVNQTLFSLENFNPTLFGLPDY